MKKETKKKIGSILVAGTLLLGNNVVVKNNNFAYAKGIDTNNTKEITVTYNGEELEFDQEPIIENGRTKVPFRKIFESMGTIVYYNNSESSILALTKTGDIITHKIGTNTATINGEEKTYDSNSTLLNGRTVIPVRMVSELLGADVEWLEDERKVEIEKEEVQIDQTRKEVMNHVLDVNYNPKDTNRYVDYKNKHPELSIEQAIIDVNIDLDKELVLTAGDGVGKYAELTHYEPREEDIEIVENTNNPYIYINKFNHLRDDYEPSDIVNYAQIEYGGYHKIRDIVVNDLTNLINDAKNAGIKINILHTFLNYVLADSNFFSVLSAKRFDMDENYAYNRYPIAEASELRTGLTVNFNSDAESYEERLLDLFQRGALQEYQKQDYENLKDEINKNETAATWLRQNSYKYGFVERYPKDKSKYTRYEYVPNFYRYVGIDVAKKMYEENLCFDEYFASYLNPIVNEYAYSINNESTQKVLKKY